MGFFLFIATVYLGAGIIMLHNEPGKVTFTEYLKDLLTWPKMYL